VTTRIRCESRSGDSLREIATTPPHLGGSGRRADRSGRRTSPRLRSAYGSASRARRAPARTALLPSSRRPAARRLDAESRLPRRLRPMRRRTGSAESFRVPPRRSGGTQHPRPLRKQPQRLRRSRAAIAASDRYLVAGSTAGIVTFGDPARIGSSRRPEAGFAGREAMCPSTC
jgi:hypothetical protein